MERIYLLPDVLKYRKSEIKAKLLIKFIIALVI